MKEKRYEITVVVPVYNVEKYLGECLNSIVAQKFESYEVLMIDDGSTDSSGEIAEQYAEQYEHFTVIHQENQGLAAVRNLGISLANGEYLCFVDSDDVIREDYLLRLYAGIKDYSADMVIADYHEVDEDGKVIKKDYGICFYQDGLVEDEKLFHALTIGGECHYATVVVVAWNKLVRTEIMKKIYYPIGVNHEDEFAIMPLLLACNRIVWVSEVLYLYRQRETGIIGKKCFSEAYFRVLDAYENRIKLSKQLRYENIQRRFKVSYFNHIVGQYYMMRKYYGATEKEAYGFHTRRMRQALWKYGSVLGKKVYMKYIIFSVFPEYYMKHFL